jgi:hypothetical protein
MGVPRWNNRLQNSPHPHVAPSTYGAEIPNETLNKIGQENIQAVTGTLLYYSKARIPLCW